MGTLPLPSTYALSCSQELRQRANPSLLFDKLLDRWTPAWSLAEDARKVFLTRFTQAYERSPAKEEYSLLAKRRRQLHAELKESGWLVEQVQADVGGGAPKTDGRLVTGLGLPHPLETGFLFDRPWGVPYLPGSSVKGAARSWAVQAQAEWDPDWQGRLDQVFGKGPETDDDSKDHAGGVTFFDAYPSKWPKLVVDIVNCHYRPYYDDPEHEAPADYHSPIPVCFLTVSSEQEFDFAVGVADKAAEYLLNLAVKAVRGAMRDTGFGAKTSVGYGYFAR